jgi:DNA primase
LYWPETKNYWCRKCEAKGFTDSHYQLTPEQIAEAKRLAAEREAAEHEARKSAVQRVSEMLTLVEFYQRQAAQAADYWHAQGLTDDTISRYRLGYSAICPTAKYSASYVIPSFIGEILVSIRHRLKSPNGEGKYRPEFAGLPAQPFNVNSLKPSEGLSFGLLNEDECLLVEGEVKAMYLDQLGFSVAGLPGVQSWRDEFTRYFKYKKTCYICFDDHTDAAGYRVGYRLEQAGLDVRIVKLPVKPDDFFVVYGFGIGEFMSYLALADRI